MERKAIRVRFEPNQSQQNKLAQAAGSKRFIYNWALNRWQEYYKEHHKTIPLIQLSAELTQLKYQPATAWLKNVDSQLQPS